MTLVVKNVAFRCIAAGALLLAGVPRLAAGQDTLSDSAWKADVARRAAVRHAAQAKGDSAAMLVDTIEVTPLEISVHVGDTLLGPALTGRLKAVAKGKDGRIVPNFHPVYLFPRSTPAFAIGQGQIVVLGPGEVVVRVVARVPTGPPEAVRPVTSVRLVARP